MHARLGVRKVTPRVKIDRAGVRKVTPCNANVLAITSSGRACTYKNSRDLLGWGDRHEKDHADRCGCRCAVLRAGRWNGKRPDQLTQHISSCALREPSAGLVTTAHRRRAALFQQRRGRHGLFFRHGRAPRTRTPNERRV